MTFSPQLEARFDKLLKSYPPGRQRSAMIPIINQNITGEKVSVYNQRVNAKFPLNGLKLKNISISWAVYFLNCTAIMRINPRLVN